MTEMYVFIKRSSCAHEIKVTTKEYDQIFADTTKQSDDYGLCDDADDDVVELVVTSTET